MSQNSKWLLYVLVLCELLNSFENRGILKETKMLITSEKKKKNFSISLKNSCFLKYSA